MRQRRRFLLFNLAIFLTIGLPALPQICSNPTNIIYGLDVSGNIIPITVSTGVLGAKINAAYGGNASVNPNGIGYNSVTGKFYFFKRPPSSAPQEFVSYDPGLATTTVLASCPSANIIYVGCTTADGTGYYCWDSQGELYYYKIATNSWTLITTSIKDQYGKDVDSILRKHGSGDAAIDGSGNMIMLRSSNARFAVYRMKRPLPTTAVASITVTEVLPPTNPPGKFVGIALNSTGQIFMNTANPDNRLFRLENNLTLTFISNLTGEIEDLTSCNFPLGALAQDIQSFSVSPKGNAVILNWQKAG